MNKTESEYAGMLRLKVNSGEIIRYDYEALTFRLADNTRYTPDFVVVYPDHIELHEVKGGFCRDDARVKFKVAADRFPEFAWVMAVRKSKKEGWSYETY